MTDTTKNGHGFGGIIGCKRNALNFLKGMLQQIALEKRT